MPAKNKNTVREWFDTIFYGGLIAIIFRSFLLEPFNIPSGSMIPSLQVGDHIFVQKWSYGYSRFSFPFGSWNLWDGRFWAKHEPDTGDIIVFRKPNGNVEYVKRLIGKPNDTVQMKSGRLYINGQMIERKNPRPYVLAVLPKEPKRGKYTNNNFEIDGNKIYVDNKPAEFNYTIQYDSNCKNPYKKLINLYGNINGENLPESEASWKPTEISCGIFILTEYDEILPNGVEHSIVEIADNEPLDNTEIFTVPENHLFFMGDDRDLSADSRTATVSYVNRDNVLGRVWFIWYSHNYYAPMLALWDWGKKMRWDRFGLKKKQ